MTAQEILGRLDGVEPAGDRQWRARCPAHDDENPSLSIRVTADGQVLLYCHAGCATEDVTSALDVDMSELFPDRSSGNGGGMNIVATYDYVDEDGALLYQVVRLSPKAFRQRSPDGSGGWTWNLKGVRRVLYRLPEVRAAAEAGGLVVAVEGEKDADRLAALGLAATANPGGASRGRTKWRREFSESLAGAHVVVLGDNDEPGRAHAEAVARATRDFATSVKVIELPGLPEGGDVSDWLDAGGDVGELFGLVKAADEWKPPPATPKTPAPAGGVTRLYGGDPPTLTDTGNSSRLIELHGDRLRYVHGWASWLVWQGARWAQDAEAALTAELAKDVGVRLKREAAEIADADLAKKMFAFGQSSLSAARIASMVKLARGIPGVIVEHETLDVDGWLLGVENGVIDLRPGAFREADPADLMTMQAPVEHDPEATAPRWERALEEWFPAPEVRDYVQRVAGAALVGAQRDHLFVIHYGTGGNGKGTFIRALQKVLGPYAVEIHLSLLVETKHREHDTVKADLFRTRLAVATETERRVRLAEASVKNLTGGDRIRARRMREDPWSFDPTHSLWLQTNVLPEIGGRDEGIWRRVRVVKWENTFRGKQADPDLDDKLAAEASGILRWLVEGCREWQRRGLDEPEAVVRETLAYRGSQDVLARFATDTGLVFEKGRGIAAGKLQELLGEWATEEGIEVGRLSQGIGEWLRERDCRQTRPRLGGHKRRYWTGVGFPGGEETAESEGGQ